MAGSDVTRIAELIWKGDNHSAIKAQTEIAEQSGRTTKVLKGDSDEQAASFVKVREESTALRDSMVGMLGMVGIGGLAFGLKDLAEDGIQLQSSQAGLRASLKETGNTAAGVFSQMSTAAQSLSTRGGFGTTTSLQGMAAFTRETRSATEALKLNALTTDIARAKNIDYASAQSIVAKAYTGQVKGLQSLLGPMVANKDAAVGLSTAHAQTIATLENESALMGKMGGMWLRQQMVNDHITAQQAALAQLTDKRTTAQQALSAATQVFGGYASKVYSNTTAGKVSNLHDAFHNLTEELGKSLNPAMNELLGIGMHVAEWMAQNKKLVLEVSLAFAGLGAAMGLTKGVKAIGGLFGDVRRLAGAAGKLGPAFSGAADIVGTAFSGIQAAGVAAFSAIKAAAATTYAFIMDNPWMIMAALGIAAIVEIATHWKQFEAGVIGVWHAIEGAVSGAWQGIESTVSSGVNWIWSKIKWLGDEAKKLIADTPLGGIIGFGSNLLGGHVGRAFGDLAQGASGGVYNAQSGTLGLPYRNMVESGSGGQQHVTVTPQSQITLRTNDREIGKATLRWALNSAARGPTSLSGGSLVTGSAGLSPAGS